MKPVRSRCVEFIISCSLLVLCVLESASAQARSSPSDSKPSRALQLQQCKTPKLDESARCGTYEVFEDRARKAGRKIALNVMVLPAAEPKAAPHDPVFFIAGGPGQSAVAVAAAAGSKFMAGLRRERDIVLVDQRGTGASHPLNCALSDGSDDLKSLFWEELFPADRLRACRAGLEKDTDLTSGQVSGRGYELLRSNSWVGASKGR